MKNKPPSQNLKKIAFVGNARVLSLKPGDALVIEFPLYLNPTQREYLKRNLWSFAEEFDPSLSIPLLVLERGKLRILRNPSKKLLEQLNTEDQAEEVTT